MFGSDVTKIRPNFNYGFVNQSSNQGGNNFVKNTLGIKSNLSCPRTKSDFTQDELCGADVKAEKLDLLA